MGKTSVIYGAASPSGWRNNKLVTGCWSHRRWWRGWLVDKSCLVWNIHWWWDTHRFKLMKRRLYLVNLVTQGSYDCPITVLYYEQVWEPICRYKTLSGVQHVGCGVYSQQWVVYCLILCRICSLSRQMGVGTRRSSCGDDERWARLSGNRSWSNLRLSLLINRFSTMIFVYFVLLSPMLVSYEPNAWNIENIWENNLNIQWK